MNKSRGTAPRQHHDNDNERIKSIKKFHALGLRVFVKFSTPLRVYTTHTHSYIVSSYLYRELVHCQWKFRYKPGYILTPLAGSFANFPTPVSNLLMALRGVSVAAVFSRSFPSIHSRRLRLYVYVSVFSFILPPRSSFSSSLSDPASSFVRAIKTSISDSTTFSLSPPLSFSLSSLACSPTHLLRPHVSSFKV